MDIERIRITDAFYSFVNKAFLIRQHKINELLHDFLIHNYDSLIVADGTLNFTTRQTEVWSSPEGYFVDWDNSYKFEDLHQIESILDDLENQVSDTLSFKLESRDHSSSYKLYNFVFRNLHRRLEEEKKSKPSSNPKEQLLQAISSLKESLTKDKLLRERSKGCRLSNFCCLDAAKQELNKKLIRRIALIIIVILFSCAFEQLNRSARPLDIHRIILEPSSSVNLNHYHY